MDPNAILLKYYPSGSLASHILSVHSEAVAGMATGIARKLNLLPEETQFIREAALLHDIGIFYTAAPELGCTGALPYICHGFLGYNLLLPEGLPKHALVCERHTGTGLTLNDIENLNGLLPLRPMEPVSLAEKIITYCDKFFSKDPGRLKEIRPLEEVLKGLSKYGEEKVNIFMEWHNRFNL